MMIYAGILLQPEIQFGNRVAFNVTQFLWEHCPPILGSLQLISHIRQWYQRCNVRTMIYLRRKKIYTRFSIIEIEDGGRIFITYRNKDIVCLVGHGVCRHKSPPIFNVSYPRTSSSDMRAFVSGSSEQLRAPQPRCAVEIVLLSKCHLSICGHVSEISVFWRKHSPATMQVK